MAGEFLDGLSPRALYKAIHGKRKDEEPRRLRQRKSAGNSKSVASSRANKENVTTGAKPLPRRKNAMFKPPPRKDLTALIPTRPRSIRLLARALHEEFLADRTNFKSAATEDDPRIVGGDSPLTTAPSSPSQSYEPSEYDDDLPAHLFERLAAHQRVRCRRKAYWSSDDESSGESEVEVLPADRRKTADSLGEPHASPTPQLVQGPAPLLATVVEHVAPLLVTPNAVGEQVEMPQTLPPHLPSASTQTQNHEDQAVDGILAHPTPQSTSIPAVEHPLSDRSPSSPPRRETDGRKGTVKRTAAQLLDSILPGATVNAKRVRPSDDELEALADVLVAILLSKEGMFAAAEELLIRAKEAESSWKPDWFALVLKHHNFLRLEEAFDGTVLCRYRMDCDPDYNRRLEQHWQTQT